MKKKLCSGLLMAIMIVCAVSVFGMLAGCERQDGDTVLAEYNGLKVTQVMVDRQQSATKLSAYGADVETYR
ncbi:MAG: hypothetical protein J6K00_06125 [Oscillospiraceae bacterium]|jgi:lipoprotein|nr:hypothetical protein [Oscillospiraceae bacterium]